jgi:hypothetical protein
MLSESLTEHMPVLKYEEMPKGHIFFGCRIKNLYDEKRLKINPLFNAKRYSIKEKKLFFYGIILDSSIISKQIMQKINSRKPFDLIGYSSLLESFNLTCENCFFNLQPPIYPFDNIHINKYLTNFKYDNFIQINQKIPAFQQFTSLDMFIVCDD